MRTRRFHLLSTACAVVFLGGGLAALRAQESFTPPQAYGADRYEREWQMNPFTLKTAPVALAKVSFAQDLAIGSFYGDRDNPTVVVVNTKTHDRTKLQKDQPSADGLTLVSWSLQPSRKDTSAEISLGGEKAVIHYDNSYIRQASAEGAGSGARPPGAPGTAAAGGTPVDKNLLAQGLPQNPTARPMPSLVPPPDARARLNDTARRTVVPPSQVPALRGGRTPLPTPKTRRDGTLPVIPPRTPVPAPTAEPAPVQ